jgi:hypothetical protein
MTEAQKEHARLLARAKEYLVESNEVLAISEKGCDKNDINKLKYIICLDERVIEFLEANAPSA